MSNRSDTLQHYLDQVLKQWKSTILLQGLSLIAAALVLALGVSMAADYLIGLDMTARLLLLLLGLAGVFLVARHFLLTPLKRIPTRLQLARFVEERHPEFRDGFVSAVEFESHNLEGVQKIFLEKLLTGVTEQTGHVDFRQIVDRKRLYRAEGLAGLAIVMMALIALMDVGLFSRLTLRYMAPWTQKGTLRSADLSVEPGDARVPRGGSQQVRVTIAGRLPSQVRLMSRAGSQEIWTGTEMSETETTALYTLELFGLGENTEYYIDAGRSRSETYTLTVYDAPLVERIDVDYAYPAYTGLASETQENKGDITAPVDTRVTLRITASKPVDTARLSFSNGTALALDTKRETMTGSFVVKEDLSYTIHLVDADGLPNSNPVEYFIRTLRDQEPRVAITQPGRDTRVSPIEEVTIRAEAEDDFGLSSFTLSYSVNGGQEKTIDLRTEGNTESRTQWDGAHTLYLEELSVAPGDFISYYATANDSRGAGGKVSTDMYFLEVKPFEETYRQASGGGGGGGGAAGLQPGRLTQRQKEVIAATWRVIRDENKVEANQTAEDRKVVANAQDAVREMAEESLTFMRFQAGMADEDIMKLADLLEEAIEPMEQAAKKLRNGALPDALPPEQEALRSLMRVDAMAREFEVAMARNGMSSDAPLDLSDTSELELKRDDNRYETPDQMTQSQQQSHSLDDALQRVRELARRQQQLNSQMRQSADNERQSDAERRRELDRLRREQSQLRQQAEELARQLSQTPGDPQSTREMNQALRDATGGLRQGSEEMAESTRQLQRDNPRQAAGQGSQALQRIEDATQQLQRAQGQSLERLAREATQRADRLATRQEQLARAVDELKKEKDKNYSGVRARLDALNDGRAPLSEAERNRKVNEFVRKKLNDIAGAKNQTLQELDRLKNDLDYLNRQAAKDQPETAAAADEARRAIDGKDLNRKIERSRAQLNPESLDRSTKTEAALTSDMEELADQVRNAQDSLVQPDQDQLARAQNNMRDALSDWQNLQRQLDRLQRGGQRPGSQPQAGQQQFSQDFRRQFDRLQDMTNQMPRNAQGAQQLRDQLNRAAALGNEPWKVDRNDWNELHQGIARALQDAQMGIRNQLQQTIQKEKLFMARDEEVPPQYRDIVNKYYEKLSKDVQK